MDVTLPRINYIKCPNSECISNTSTFDTNNRFSFDQEKDTWASRSSQDTKKTKTKTET